MSENDANQNEIEHDVRELASLLKPKLGESLEVLEYSVDNLIGKGENFAGVLLKVIAKVRIDENSPVKEYNFVAKGILDAGFYVNWSVVLKKEAFMYSDVIPLYAEVELKCGIDENLVISNNLPKLFGYRLSLDPKSEEADDDAVILLDNLKTQGYYIQNKTAGLDLEHATEAIKVLAKFHALGVAAKNKRPDQFAKVKEVASDRSGFDYKDFEIIYTNFIIFLRQEPRYAKYLARFEKIVATMNQGWNLHLVNHELWSTVIHYDFWTNNLLFHKDDCGRIERTKFIDFQSYAFADLCIDLYYFMCTSLSDQVKIDHFDELLDIYYDKFIATLESVDVNVDVYSRQKFDEILKQDGWFEILHCAMALNFFTFQPDPAWSKTEIVKKLLTFQVNEVFHKKLEVVLDIYERKGWFDGIQ